ncbi:Na+/H+ antiporter [Actinomadura fulvescens]|uniref:Na+/H+ antiporter n=1 Tax=Actinomadura fulvescens TaxID=46160 RepID=A0ABN3PYQ7_9ACTN
MDTLTIVVVLMLATIALVAVAPRLGRPYPVLMTLLGFGLALIPAVPHVRIDPELILPLFLPPLIYASAHRLSWPVCKRHLCGLLALAVLLVLVTTAAVAVTVWAVVPGVTLAAAVALGAVIAPPDPVAAEAVAGPLRMPRRLLTVLKTEGLFNDATALIVFQVAVAAQVTGRMSAPEALMLFAYAAVAAVALGLAIGWITRRAMRWLGQPMARSALTLVVPFAGYLLADRLKASGVITVVVIALYLAHRSSEADYAERLSGRAFWEVVELLVTGVAFGLIGLELRVALEDNQSRLGDMLLNAGAVCLIIVLVRALWLLLHSALIGRRIRSDAGEHAPRSWREAVLMTCCGMRGLATLALALAMPLAASDGTPFPARSELVFVACAVIVTTLILPGLTMPALVRVLGVREQAAANAEREVAVRACVAALDHLDEVERQRDVPADIVEPLRQRQRAKLATIAPERLPADTSDQLEQRRRRLTEMGELYGEMLTAARHEVLTARAEPGVDPQAADVILHRIDLRTAGLPGMPAGPEITAVPPPDAVEAPNGMPRP